MSDIADILASFKGTGKTAFVQFAYDPDYDGKKTTNSEGKEVYADVEPKDFNLLLDHVSQIVHVVKPYQQYITAIRCGMVGPYGGEITKSSDKNEVPLWQSDLEGSIKEMFTIHLSFLNIGYKAAVFEALSETDYNGETAFLYLFKHMGYRYVITNSEIEPKGNSAEIRLQYRNDGFANMPFHHKKVLSVIFQPENGDAIEVSTKQEFVNAPSGTSDPTSIALSVSTEKLSADKYTVYLKVSDADGDYPVRFANNLWNDGLKANKIGVIEK